MLRRLGLIDFGGEGTRVAGTRFMKTGRQPTTTNRFDSKLCVKRIMTWIFFVLSFDVLPDDFGTWKGLGKGQSSPCSMRIVRGVLEVDTD